MKSKINLIYKTQSKYLPLETALLKSAVSNTAVPYNFYEK